MKIEMINIFLNCTSALSFILLQVPLFQFGDHCYSQHIVSIDIKENQLERVTTKHIYTHFVGIFNVSIELTIQNQ